MRKERVSAIVFTMTLAALLVTGGAAVAAGPNVSGHWWANNGQEYDITQTGTAFQWHVPATGELGVGTISGNTCSATWPFGVATGNIFTDPAGYAVEIHWSNGVVFMRGGPPGGGPGGPPPGPGPTPPPPPPTPPGGGGSELSFSFGPNPAWPGAEVWVNLSLPVAHKVLIWHNGALMPITKFTGNNFLVVKLPMKVSTGPFRVEYQGKRLDSKQSRSELEIKPIDITGNWVYSTVAPGTKGVIPSTITQKGDDFTWCSSNCMTVSTGKIYDGNKLVVTDSTGIKAYGSITSVDENGRAQKLECDVVGGTKRGFKHPN